MTRIFPAAPRVVVPVREGGAGRRADARQSQGRKIQCADAESSTVRGATQGRRVGEDWSMPDVFTTRVLNITSGSREAVVDLTGECEAFLREAADGRDGLLNVFVPHATAGVAVLETGAGSEEDLLAALRTLLPADDRGQHRHGSPGHGRDHVLPAIVPPHATLPVLAGRLELGTGQSVCLVDTNVDNADRQVRLSFLGLRS